MRLRLWLWALAALASPSPRGGALSLSRHACSRAVRRAGRRQAHRRRRAEVAARQEEPEQGVERSHARCPMGLRSSTRPQAKHAPMRSASGRGAAGRWCDTLSFPTLVASAALVAPSSIRRRGCVRIAFAARCGACAAAAQHPGPAAAAEQVRDRRRRPRGCHAGRRAGLKHKQPSGQLGRAHAQQSSQSLWVMSA